MRTSVRRSEKGFTLIELGIVVAVIAILATVVLFGRGFLTSAGTSKGIEAINTIRKAAATYNGVQAGAAATGDCLTALADRELLPADAAGDWTVLTGFVVTECVIETGTNMGIKMTTPNLVTAQDMATAIGDSSATANCPAATVTAVGQSGDANGGVLDVCFAL